jgi:hypothetical protein
MTAAMVKAPDTYLMAQNSKESGLLERWTAKINHNLINFLFYTKMVELWAKI